MNLLLPSLPYRVFLQVVSCNKINIHLANNQKNETSHFYNSYVRKLQDPEASSRAWDMI